MGKFNLAEVLNLDSSKVSNLDTEMQQIPLALIDPHPDNFFAVEEDITDLAESISVNGLCQPLIVTPTEGGRYRVIAGHRRRMALLELSKTDDRYKMVNCIIRKPASPEMEMLMLIQTNTAAREIQWNERNKAATMTEQILIKLQQEQGVKLPGKMRSHVAKIIKASESQIARAKYISEHLDKGVAKKLDNLSDSAAYSLAHLPIDQQQQIAAQYKSRSWQLTPAAIKAAAARMDSGEPPFTAATERKRTCYVRKGNPDCEHLAVQAAHEKRIDRPTYQRCNDRCCNYCAHKYHCTDVCPYVAKFVEAEKGKKNYQMCDKLRVAREKSGITVEDAAKSMGLSSADEVIRFETSYQLTVARLLDFCALYHTDPSTVLGIAVAAEPPATTKWRKLYTDGTPERGQLCHVLVTDASVTYDKKRLCDTWDAVWDGSRFVSAQNGRTQTKQTILGWIPAPETPEGYSYDVKEVFD